MAIGKTISARAAKAASGAKAGAKMVPPTTRAVITDVALKSGGRVLRQAFERKMLGNVIGKGAKAIPAQRSMAQTLLGAAAAKIATRSIPGALLVGGGLIAKTLYDRHQKRKRGEPVE